MADVKKNIAIYDEDSMYLSRLLNYISHTEDFGYTITGYTNHQSLLSYLQNNQIDLLMVDEIHLSELIPITNVKHLLVLTENTVRQIEGYKTVFKYQSAKKTLSIILETLKVEEEEEIQSQARKIAIYTVFSPSHEAYHTAYAYSYANFLAQTIPTLLIDLSLFPFSFHNPVEEHQQGLSELMYYMEQGSDVKIKLKELIKSKQLFSCLSGVNYALDLFHMEQETFHLLLKEILNLNRYEAVILNVSIFSSLVFELLTISDRVILIKDREVSDGHIQSAFLNQLKEYMLEKDYDFIEEICISREEAEEILERRIPIQQSMLWARLKGREPS